MRLISFILNSCGGRPDAFGHQHVSGSKKQFEIGFGSYDEDLHSQGYAARPLEKYAKLKISIIERLVDRQKIGKR